jgi:DNA polymerase III delta prime subunit
LRLGDLLVSGNLVTQAQVDMAIARQQEAGGRLGEQLVAIGAITTESLEAFLNEIPPEPESINATGISATELLTLMLKQIHLSRLETIADFVRAIKLPPGMVSDLVQVAVSRNLLVALGMAGSSMRYELSEQGRKWAQEALGSSLYAGPAPVTLEDFCARVDRQKITNQQVTYQTIRSALQGYTITDKFIKQIGPALNSGRAMLLYGPPGNGKTSVAQRFAEVFNAVIYIPYSVMIDGYVMKVYDPSVHVAVAGEAERTPSIFTSLRRELFDKRWVAIRRPFIIAGGELTLEMLDLSYDKTTGFYEAPLHIKGLGGCFVVDDFGRQIVSPTTLLNRWIVPMESRVDYLKLHTGKSFSIPFQAMLIFSTNIDPGDLMDPAFLRRLPYKIEVGPPSLEDYFAIFEAVCGRAGVPVTPAAIEKVIVKIVKEQKLELAAFHAAFIIDQVVAIARFMSVPPQLDDFSIDYAIKNLVVRPRHQVPL